MPKQDYLKILLISVGTWWLGTTWVYANTQVEDQALQKCIDSAIKKSGIAKSIELKKLKCHKKGIVSLVGIERFIGLESLSLFSNNIQEANLSSLKNLQSLNLASNELRSINLEDLAELRSLYVFKNNLKTINFKGLLKLEKVRAMQNELEVLDITPLIALEEAYFWDNELEDLAISGLNKLTFLDVKQNPMPDELYDFYDEQSGITISHDGNADDWK